MKIKIALLIITLSIFAYFSKDLAEVETKYECVGSFDKSYLQEKVIYIKLNEYRFFTKAWAKSDATIFVEIPSKFVDYISVVTRVGDSFQMYDDNGGLRGNFSTLSNAITLKILNAFFDGKCRKI